MILCFEKIANKIFQTENLKEKSAATLKSLSIPWFEHAKFWSKVGCLIH